MIRCIAGVMLATIWTTPSKAQNDLPDDHILLQFYQNHQYDAAAEYIKGFYPDTIRDQVILNRLGYCYRMSGNYRQAETYYLQLYGMDSLNVSALLNLGAINVQRRLFGPAEDYYKRVIAIDSNHVSAYVSLSGIMRRKPDWDAALAYLHRANRLQPGNMDIANDLVRVYVDLKEYEQADSVLDAALRIDPDNGILLYAKTEVAEALKNYPTMIRACERLAALGEESVQIKTRLARGFFYLNDYIGSLNTYQERIDSYGEDLGELDYYYMAMSCKALKRYKEGLEYMDKVLKAAISPNTAFYYGRKADLHDLANQPSAAASSYLKSFHFDVIPLHYYSLALVYDSKLRDQKNALRYFQLYLKQAPGEGEKAYRHYAQKRLEELK